MPLPRQGRRRQRGDEWEPLEELPCDVEPEKPVVVGDAAARDLARRDLEPVRDVELERVAADALFDGRRHLVDAWAVAGARHDLANDVERRPDPQPQADAGDERVRVLA